MSTLSTVFEATGTSSIPIAARPRAERLFPATPPKDLVADGSPSQPPHVAEPDTTATLPTEHCTPDLRFDVLSVSFRNGTLAWISNLNSTPWFRADVRIDFLKIPLDEQAAFIQTLDAFIGRSIFNPTQWRNALIVRGLRKELMELAENQAKATVKPIPL